MNINIAFNTIIYIMVFLFPGILFRRAFFSGKFNKHFESGNNIERLLWNILFSIFSLFLFCCSITFIDFLTANNFAEIFGLNSQVLLDNFIFVYENKFPEILKSSESLSNIFYVLVSLYVFSTIIGYFFNKIIFIFGLEKRFSIFKFQNNWDYLTISNRQNNTHHKLGDIHYTKVDIKTNDNELFTGKLHEIVFDKEGKIEVVAIQEAYKFYKLDKETEKEKIREVERSISLDNPNIIVHFFSTTEFVYKKRIKGNVFTVSNDKIQNISITYIKISHFFEKFQKFIRYIVSTLLLLVALFSLSYLIWDFHIINFSSIYKRIAFCLTTPIASCFSILFIIHLFNLVKAHKSRKHWINLKDSFFYLLFVLIPYSYIFDFLRFSLLVIIMIIALILLGIFAKKKVDADHPVDAIEVEIEEQ